MNGLTCKNCMFWVKDQVDDGDGNCQRNPPTPFIQMGVNPITQAKGIIVLAFWPKTRPEIWCGELREGVEH